MKRFGYLFIACLFLVLASFSFKEDATDSYSPNSVLIFKKRLNKKYDTGYHLDVAYPEVRCRDIAQGHQINKHIHKLTSGAISEFTKRVQKLYKPSKGYHYMNLDYTVHHTDSYMLSVKFKKTAQFIGYKQGLDLSTTFNYDLLQDKIIKFNELFDKTQPYQRKIAQLIHKRYKVKVPTTQLNTNTKFCLNDRFITIYLPEASTNNARSYQLSWSDMNAILNLDNEVIGVYVDN